MKNSVKWKAAKLLVTEIVAATATRSSCGGGCSPCFIIQAAALNRADRIVKNMLKRAKQQQISSGTGRAPTPAPVSDIVGSSTPASSMDNEVHFGRKCIHLSSKA